jgi:hypothetical protein
VNAQRVRLSGAALILSAVIACASDPATGPGSAARLKRMRMNDAPDTVTVMSRAVPLAQQYSASQVIGPEGGTLELPATGLKVIVPRDAVPAAVTFTVTAVPGAMIAYQFGPHGTTFKYPLRVEQDIRGVTIPQGESVLAGYFPDQADLLVDDVVGTIEERLPAQLDAAAAKVRFEVTHFSGYLVASGRTRVY